MRPGAVTVRDYNFKKPALNLQSGTGAEVDSHLEVYDFQGNYDEPALGQSRAQVRLEGQQALRRRRLLLQQSLCLHPGRGALPARAGGKPLIKGGQSALVVGPEGEEIYTDEHGRVKDAELVKRGWEVEYILEKGTSKPYLDALEKAGIKIHIGPKVP